MSIKNSAQAGTASLTALILISAMGCEKGNMDPPTLQENTEAYIAAHGIVPGQVNELRIGDTLFRFPAGMGLNPYTAQKTIRTKDGSPMTLSQKECLEQGKCEKVATPIVKGRADKVTFYLMPEKGYAPNPSPFGGGVRVTISGSGRPRGAHESDENIKDKPVVIDHLQYGLREYRSKKDWIGSVYKSLNPEYAMAADGGELVFGCQPSALPTGGLCAARYWKANGKYNVSFAMDKPFFLEYWRETYPAVIRFADSVVVK
ncbi:MAG: hypothetical protein AB1418_00310 [Pseudomonadota bacterium]